MIGQDTIQKKLKHPIDRQSFGLDKLNGAVYFFICIGLGKTEVAVGSDPGLPIDSIQSLDGAYIEGILAKR